MGRFYFHLRAGDVLIVLSQKVAVRFDKNQLLGEIHAGIRGLRWIVDEQMTVNRGLRPMSKDL
jgi:hypothetical protein